MRECQATLRALQASRKEDFGGAPDLSLGICLITVRSPKGSFGRSSRSDQTEDQGLKAIKDRTQWNSFIRPNYYYRVKLCLIFSIILQGTSFSVSNNLQIVEDNFDCANWASLSLDFIPFKVFSIVIFSFRLYSTFFSINFQFVFWFIDL